MCISLATQCASVVLTLAFPGNADWISLSKSMSYAVSMVLTFSIACYLGASHPAPRAGTCAAKWVALYFAAFYCASFLEQTLRPDAFVPLVVVLLCLVVSAVLMLGNDWSELMPSQTLPEEAQSSDPTIELDHTSWCRDVALRAGLTGRETDVLGLLLDNVSVKEIAVQSGVSINTVRSQVQAVYRKLDVHSRDDLVELFEREAQTCRPQDEPMTGRPSSR